MARSHGGYFRLGVISGAHARSAPSPRSLRGEGATESGPDRWHERCKLACRSRPDLPARARELAGMSTFDNPFEAQRQLQCENVERKQTPYEGVVASAVMRAVFPRESARRAFLKTVGASTAL